MHVWRIDLEPPPARLHDLSELLSDEERERAGRFYFEVDRNRYTAAHAALRALLGAYLGQAPYRVPFRTGPEGKPGLSTSAALRFNLSHSRNLGLVALAHARDVGVDLEAVDRDVEVEQIAERFFSVPECHALLALPPARRRDGFFHLWSQKEAYLKGRGDGVVRGLDHFDMEADPDRPAQLLTDRREPDAARRWFLYSLEPGPGFRAALAVERGPAAVRRFLWR